MQRVDFLLLQINQPTQFLRFSHIIRLRKLRLKITRQLMYLLLQMYHRRLLYQNTVPLLWLRLQRIQKLLQRSVERMILTIKPLLLLLVLF